MKSALGTIDPAIIAAFRSEFGNQGVRQGDIAKLVGMTETTFSRRLARHTNFTFDEVERVALALGLDPLGLMFNRTPSFESDG